MTALAGTIDEWVQVEPNVWMRFVPVKDSPWGAREWSEADGILTLREGLSFADYWERRANPPPPEPDPRDVKIAELEARIAKLESAKVDIRK
jgi:hypothetical protein